MSSIEQRVKAAAAQFFETPVDTVTGDKKIVGDLTSDSLCRVEFVMKIEDEFVVEIPDEHAEKFETVQNVIDYLEARTADGTCRLL